MSLQKFLATATPKAADNLITALERLPEDKRAWSPQGDARTALDMVAEIALLNGTTAGMIRGKSWPEGYDMNAYFAEKTELAKDETKCRELLKENTADVLAAIAATTDEDLEVQVQMPWGPMSLADICSYPYWNMSYHEGQINYIASMLGLLK